MMDFAGRLFIVTGASSGLGRAMAERLAVVCGADVVVAARREDRLNTLAEHITACCGSRVLVVPVDLADPKGPEYLWERARSMGTIFGLVNNAGVTHYGPAINSSWDSNQDLLYTDLRAVIRLTLLCARGMVERGEGAILNVTSLAAFLPVPYQSVYAASKRGVFGFTESLAREVRGAGVVMTSLAPGGIATEMITRAGLDVSMGRHSWILMPAERVAKIGIRAWRRGRGLCVPGWLNRALVSVAPFVPRALVAGISERLYRPPKPPAKLDTSNDRL